MLLVKDGKNHKSNLVTYKKKIKWKVFSKMIQAKILLQNI
jgi:hypothetical protein